MARFEQIVIAVGAVFALYLLLIVVIAHRFTMPKRVRLGLPSNASDAPVLHTVSFPARGDALRLTATYTETANAESAIILVHGRNARRGEELRGDTSQLVAHFARLGFSVLLVDLRGHGDSANARLTFGVRERRDVLGAVDFLLARGYAPRRIGVLGASMGGVSAIGAAAHEPAIGAVVTDSAFCTLHDVLRIQFVRLTRLPGWCLSGATMVASVLTGEKLRHHTATHDMTRLRGRPTLVIHARHDPFVPVSHAHALAHAGDTQLWITDGTRHLSSYTDAPDEYARVVGEFFQLHLLNISEAMRANADANTICGEYAMRPDMQRRLVSSSSRRSTTDDQVTSAGVNRNGFTMSSPSTSWPSCRSSVSR